MNFFESISIYLILWLLLLNLFFPIKKRHQASHSFSFFRKRPNDTINRFKVALELLECTGEELQVDKKGLDFHFYFQNMSIFCQLDNADEQYSFYILDTISYPLQSQDIIRIVCNRINVLRKRVLCAYTQDENVYVFFFCSVTYLLDAIRHEKILNAVFDSFINIGKIFTDRIGEIKNIALNPKIVMWKRKRCG